MRLNNSECREVEKEIVEIIKSNGVKKVKWRYIFKNKLIIFTYYLKLFFTLNCVIRLFYQTYLIHLMT